MRLVIINEQNVIVADYGDFGVDEAEAFFQDAMSAIAFRKELPEVMLRNEIQLRMLTDTLSKMGLLHGNPDAIQEWMRPYITNEINRLNQRQSLFQRTKAKLSDYQERAWDWIKAELFAGASKIFRKIINSFKK